MVRTNAMRLLDAENIKYRTAEYEYDENDLSGVKVARSLNMPEEMLFKTLVTKGDKNGYNVFCIPVAEELDLKKAAHCTKNKKIEMLHVKDLLSVTGYIRGGCSPIGMKKKFPTFIDESAILFDEISISAGVRGCQIIANPEDIAKYVDAEFIEVTKQ